MGRRFEEKVDVEELARLENPENASDGKIRVKMPNKKVNEMFALASQILGGRRVTVLCEDGETRMARIPGKMRRRQWVREGDLIIVWPWDFQDSKADVKHRYTKTQAMYLSRKGVLPDDVDMFGMGANVDDDGEHDDLFASGSMDEEEAAAEEKLMTPTTCSLMMTMTTCLPTMAMTTCSLMAVLRRHQKKRKKKRLKRPLPPLWMTSWMRNLRVTMTTMTTTLTPCLPEPMR